MKQQEFIHKYFPQLQSGNVQNIPAITIEGDLNLDDNRIKALPNNLKVTGNILVRDNLIKNLPFNINCQSLYLQGNPVRTLTFKATKQMEVYLDNRRYDVDLSKCKNQTVALYDSYKLNLQIKDLEKITLLWRNNGAVKCLINSLFSKYVNWNQVRSKVFSNAWKKFKKSKKRHKCFSQILRDSWQKILVTEKIKFIPKLPARFVDYLDVSCDLKKHLLNFASEYNGKTIIKKSAKTFITEGYWENHRRNYNEVSVSKLIELPQVQRILKLHDIMEE